MKDSPSQPKRERIASFVLILLTFIGSFVPNAFVLAQEFTLRARVDEVVVPFSVMNDGRFVAGLESGDFTVLEDGRTQTIESFRADPVPLSAVLLIDTGLLPESFAAVSTSRVALVRAFNLTEQHRAIGAADEVAVYRYNNQVTRLLDFTDQDEALGNSLEWMEGFRGGVGLVGGPPPGTPVINGVPINPTANTPLTRDRRVLHDAVNEAALALRSREPERRRVILLVSDGSERASVTSYEDVQLRLLETEVQVFAIHIRTGLIERLAGSLMSRLDEYADFTGGATYATGSGNLDPLYPRITAQARSQYELIYRSANEAPSDRLVFREIEVTNRQGFDVFHRAGYYQVPP
jgi:VWFA-related protein